MQKVKEGGTITYNYNTTIKQQLDSVSAGGVTTAYTYDSKGNALTSSMYAGTSSSGTRVTSSATYSSNGEYMTSLTDSRGNTTQYTYNESRGYLDTVTTPDNTVTDYSYNSGELLSNVAVTGSNASASVAYNYDSGKRLAAIVSPGNTTYGFTYDNFDRNTAVKIGSRTLSQYYYDSKFRLGSVAYGNGTTISYGYDDLDRQTQVKINDTLRYEYQYDGTSRISQILDVQAGRKILYEYDLLDRVTQEELYDTSGKKVLSSLKLRYDDSKNRISGYDVDIQGIVKNTDYVYSTNSATPDLISGVKLNGSQKLTYSYDSLNRPVTRTLLTTTPYVTNYTYLEGNGTGKTTGMIKSVKNGSDTLSYAYDEMGNILSVSKNGSLVESYAYDSLGQLKSVTRGTDTYSYAYDNGGNLLSVNKNGTVIKTYAYGNSEWKDLLTSFNGQAITYDTIGNPLTYCGMTMTWSDGRNLATISSGTDSISYTYDVGNLRTSKTVNGVKTEYYWLDGSLQGQKTGSEYLLFQYDENGKAYGFIVKNGTQETVYYYEFNVQGDIIGIINSAGTKVAEYSYNAWGELISITGSQASTIGQKNPLRYRGYYYDAETGFYYVSSRYYDPEVGRFISADTTDILGVSRNLYDKNLFAYCDNNPVVRIDVGGMLWQYAVVRGAISTVSTILSAAVTGEELSFVEVAYAFSSGVMSSWGKYYAILCIGVDFIKTVDESVQSGESLTTTLIKGGISLIASAVSIGGLAKMNGVTLSNTVESVCDLTFGMGKNALVTGINKSISNRNKPNTSLTTVGLPTMIRKIPVGYKSILDSTPRPNVPRSYRNVLQ